MLNTNTRNQRNMCMSFSLYVQNKTSRLYPSKNLSQGKVIENMTSLGAFRVQHCCLQAEIKANSF